MKDFYFCLVYFFMNLSTLPSESTNFCLPLKNGWHFEQISTLMVFLVERVCTTFPQAQRMVAGSYLGCTLFFIRALLNYAAGSGGINICRVRVNYPACVASVRIYPVCSEADIPIYFSVVTPKNRLSFNVF